MGNLGQEKRRNPASAAPSCWTRRNATPEPLCSVSKARERRATRLAGWFLATCALLIATGAAPIAAAARHWESVPEQSHIIFEYQSNHQPAEGVFRRFSGGGTFDPAAPDSATLELRIESASIDLGDAKASAFATSSEWFDSVNHPEVVYRLMKLTPEGGNRYRAAGDLTIRGRTRPLTTTITLDVNADKAHVTGILRIDRKDYMLGVGPMSLFVSIGREVAVRFDLSARAVR